MPFNIPILLTWLRITLIPLLVAVYYFPEGWVAWIGRDTAAMLIFVVFVALTAFWPTIWGWINALLNKKKSS